MLPKTMRAWRADRFGAPAEVLQMTEVEVPAPLRSEVLVRIRATGVGLPDLLMTQGRYPLVKTPPVIPGQEMVGEVVAVGEDGAFAIGDRVIGIVAYDLGSGAFAEYARMENHRGALAPPELADIEAAGVLIPFNTAYATLVTRGALQSGETLLVLGAAGSSGIAAIQLGKVLGARVIAVASSSERLALCSGAGADHVINYKESDVVEAVNAITDGWGANLVFDPVGGAIAESMVACTAKYGRICLVGFASGAWPSFDALSLVLGNISVLGVFARGLSDEEEKDPAAKGVWGRHKASCIALLTHVAADGTFRPLVGSTHGFEQVPDVLEALERGAAPPGKSVVRVSSDEA